MEILLSLISLSVLIQVTVATPRHALLSARQAVNDSASNATDVGRRFGPLAIGEYSVIGLYYAQFNTSFQPLDMASYLQSFVSNDLSHREGRLVPRGFDYFYADSLGEAQVEVAWEFEGRNLTNSECVTALEGYIELLKKTPALNRHPSLVRIMRDGKDEILISSSFDDGGTAVSFGAGLDLSLSGVYWQNRELADKDIQSLLQSASSYISNHSTEAIIANDNYNETSGNVRLQLTFDTTPTQSNALLPYSTLSKLIANVQEFFRHNYGGEMYTDVFSRSENVTVGHLRLNAVDKSIEDPVSLGAANRSTTYPSNTTSSTSSNVTSDTNSSDP